MGSTLVKDRVPVFILLIECVAKLILILNFLSCNPVSSGFQTQQAKYLSGNKVEQIVRSIKKTT